MRPVYKIYGHENYLVGRKGFWYSELRYRPASWMENVFIRYARQKLLCPYNRSKVRFSGIARRK